MVRVRKKYDCVCVCGCGCTYSGCNLKMLWFRSAIVILISVTFVKASLSLDWKDEHNPHPDNHTIQTTDTPRFKPFTI